jgi:disulfide bond formation protein DsbB
MAANFLHPRDRLVAAAAFVLGLAAILLALASQVFGGLTPCELCLEQRLAYYWGLPLLAVMLALWRRLPPPVWYVAMLIVTAIFVWSTFMGAYHAGVEWGFWPGPTACTGIGETMDFSALNNLTPVIGCDVVQFRFLGLSLAGYNALVSLAVVILLGLSIAMRMRAGRRG